MTKSELRAKTAADIAAFVAAGNAIEVIPAIKNRVKVLCHGKKANNFVVGGSAPKLSISQVFSGK